MRVSVLAVAVLLSTSMLADRASQEVRVLELRKPIVRELAGLQSHRYRFPLRAGHYLQIDVEHRALDVVLTLVAPDGRNIRDFYRQDDVSGKQSLSHIAESTGDYQLRIASLDSQAVSGRYELVLRERRTATKRDSLYADVARVRTEAQAYWDKRTPEGDRMSLTRHQQLLPLLRALGDREGEASTLHLIAALYLEFEQADLALPYWRQAHSLDEQLQDSASMGTALNQLGYTHSLLGEGDSALVYYRLALTMLRALNDRDGEGTALYNIGEQFVELGEPDSALVYYQQTWPIVRSLGDTAGMAIVLSGLGDVEQELGRPDSALALYHRSLDLYRAVRDIDGEATSLANIGIVQRGLGRSDSALVYYRQSLARRLEIKNRGGAGVALNSIGLVLATMSQTDSATFYYRQALAIAREVGNRALASTALQNIGVQFNVSGHTDSAIAYYGQAMELARAIRDRSSETAILFNTGKVHHKAARFDSALHYAHQALVNARDTKERASEALTLASIAETHAARRDWVTSSAYYDTASSIHATVAERAGTDANRVSYAEQQSALFTNWTRVWLAQSKHLGVHRSALGALAVSERGRAQAMLDMLRRRSDMPLQLPASTRDLIAEGERYLKDVTNRKTAVLSYVVASDSVIVLFAAPGRNLIVMQRAINANELAQKVRRLRLALGVETATSGLLALRGGAPVERDSLVSFRGAVGATAATSAAQVSTARELGELLLPIELANRTLDIRELVIIPSGVLGLVPFAVLPVGARGTPLAGRYALRYAPSLAVLGEIQPRSGSTERNTRTVTAPHALVVGNPTMPSRSGHGVVYELSPLPAAELEASMVARVLGSTSLHGATATETEVRRQLGGATVVHLATHGYAYATESQARNSFVALAPDSINDGFLTIAEVLDDPTIVLRANLVILSACQTGLGDMRRAEGTIGLQRAFLVKGARSLLVSLWNVSDAATALLMRRFYAHWLGDRGSLSKAEALRLAQEDVRKTRGYESPRYWAAFQLVGVE